MNFTQHQTHGIEIPVDQLSSELCLARLTYDW